MSCRGSLRRALSQFARISSCRSLAHSRTNCSARGSRRPGEDLPVGGYRGTPTSMVGVEVSHWMIALIPVHVDHNPVERADTRHDLTVSDSSDRMRGSSRPAHRSRTTTVRLPRCERCRQKMISNRAFQQLGGNCNRKCNRRADLLHDAERGKPHANCRSRKGTPVRRTR